MTSIVPIDHARADDVERLLDVAFGTDRHGRTAYRLRAGMAAIPALSFAALDERERLAGTLQCWPIALRPAAGEAVPLILVGPVAVAPERQRGGLGRSLMEHMLAVADLTEADPLVLIGDPEYYGRFFGFTTQATAGWDLPGPFERRRLLARTGGRALPGAGMLGPRLQTRSP